MPATRRPQNPDAGYGVEAMEKRVWLTIVGTDFEVTKTEPVSTGLNVEVTVRAGEGILLNWVWLNGERSYDTYVIVDGEVRFHSPVETVAAPTFESKVLPAPATPCSSRRRLCIASFARPAPGT
jgi:hypothetical protein